MARYRGGERGRPPCTFLLLIISFKKWMELTFGLYESSQEQARTGHAYASMLASLD